MKILLSSDNCFFHTISFSLSLLFTKPKQFVKYSKETQQPPSILLSYIYLLIYTYSAVDRAASKSSFHPTAKRNRNAIYLEFLWIFRVMGFCKAEKSESMDGMFSVWFFIRQTNFVQLLGSLVGLCVFVLQGRTRGKDFLFWKIIKIVFFFLAPPRTFTLFQLSDFVVSCELDREIMASGGFVEIRNVKIITKLLIGIFE